MIPPEWNKIYQVVTCRDDLEFQWTLDEAIQKGYKLDSWRNLFNSDVGYNITAVFILASHSWLI